MLEAWTFQVERASVGGGTQTVEEMCPGRLRVVRLCQFPFSSLKDEVLSCPTRGATEEPTGGGSSPGQN